MTYEEQNERSFGNPNTAVSIAEGMELKAALAAGGFEEQGLDATEESSFCIAVKPPQSTTLSAEEFMVTYITQVLGTSVTPSYTSQDLEPPSGHALEILAHILNHLYIDRDEWCVYRLYDPAAYDLDFTEDALTASPDDSGTVAMEKEQRRNTYRRMASLMEQRRQLMSLCPAAPHCAKGAECRNGQGNAAQWHKIGDSCMYRLNEGLFHALKTKPLAPPED